MKTPQWILLLLLVAGLERLAAPPALAQNNRIRWISFRQLADSMRIHPKPIFISIGTDWCRYCRLQERQTYRNEQVIKGLNEHFYALQLDAEGKEALSLGGRTFTYQPTGANTGIHELAVFLGREKGALVYPAVVVLNTKFELVTRQTGFTEAARLKRMLEEALAR